MGTVAEPKDWIAEAAKWSITGFLHPAELGKLIDLAEGKDVLEIGSYRGLSAWGMAHTARTVTCVDTFQAATDGQRQTGQHTTLDVFKAAIRPFENVTYLVASSAEAAQPLAPMQFDMVFLDAMHTYEEVGEDIRRWWPHVRKGGMMVLHDYGHGDYPGVKRAANRFFRRRPDEEPLVTLAWWTKR